MKKIVRYMATFAFSPRMNMFDVFTTLFLVVPACIFVHDRVGLLAACVALVSLCTLFAAISAGIEHLLEPGDGK